MGVVLDRARAAVAAATVQAALAELEADELERERRRVLRAPRGTSAGRLRCGGCRRWLASAREACGCGFHNDVRGRRNDGRYA